MERLKCLIYLLYQFELAKFAITVAFSSVSLTQNSPDFLIYEDHELKAKSPVLLTVVSARIDNS